MKRIPLKDVYLGENCAVASRIKKKNDPNKWRAYFSIGRTGDEL